MNYRHQQGVGLIEVLVAVLVLAIGLLGLAGLQTQSLRFNNEAYFRTQATLLAMDMADRLRSNSELARKNSALYTFEKGDTLPAGSLTGCETSTCTPAEVAAYDLLQWHKRAEVLLPGGQVEVAPDPLAAGLATPWQSYVIRIGYSSKENSEDLTFLYRVRI